MASFEEMKKTLRKSVLGAVFAASFGSLFSMVNLQEEVDETTMERVFEKAKKENPEEIAQLEKIEKALDYQTEKSKEEEKRFYSEYLDEKDDDGYKKIPDKVTNRVKAEVSEKKALETKSERTKGGRQKTRVDED